MYPRRLDLAHSPVLLSATNAYLRNTKQVIVSLPVGTSCLEIPKYLGSQAIMLQWQHTNMKQHKPYQLLILADDSPLIYTCQGNPQYHSMLPLALHPLFLYMLFPSRASKAPRTTCHSLCSAQYLPQQQPRAARQRRQKSASD